MGCGGWRVGGWGLACSSEVGKGGEGRREERKRGEEGKGGREGEPGARWVKGGIHVFCVPLLCVAGHVDAGKSTLMGHLLFFLGQVSKRAMHK